MNVADVLAYLHTLGLHLSVAGGSLIVEPKSALTDETRALIREHKAVIMKTLMTIKDDRGPVEVMPPVQFEQAGQVITWRTGSGRTIFIAPSWVVEKYRKPGQAWFASAEIVELRAMQLDRDTIERIIDGKEIMGLEVVGTC